MKRIISVLLGIGVAVSAGAQNWQDAQLLSENQYGGTARGMAMGNALTAVGGDPASLTLNPAGSAVSAYTQFFITPGLSVSVLSAKGITIPEGGTDPVGLGNQESTGRVRMKLPSVGFILNLDKGRRSGWKRSAFSFVVNSTADYTSRFRASGLNSTTSYAASLASSADGFQADVLGSGDWFYNGVNPALRPAWADMAGYRAGMFNGITGRPGGYVAITEVVGEDGKVYMGEPLQQVFNVETTGGKHDFLINYAANYNDILYLGANLGITWLRYNRSQFFQEMPDNPDDYPAANYADGSSARLDYLRMQENLRLSGAGVYFKAGILLRPVAGLRLGAAIQTPTVITLRERYWYDAEVHATGRYLPTASSPENDWGYKLSTPFRVNAGLAYSFGQYVILSADYEMADYGAARFRSMDYTYDPLSDPNFSGVNQDIRDLMDLSHQVRVGLEVKPVSWLAIRAGYNYLTSGEVAYFNGKNLQPLSDAQKAAKAKHTASFGVGWTSGSFFADVAVRTRFVPVEYYIPYEYYYAPNPAQFYNKVVDESFLTPEIAVKSILVDAMFTIGWRF